MKLLAILLCFAIGLVFGELERRQSAKENLEDNEDIDEVRALISLDDGEKPSSSDESLRVKYARGNSFDKVTASAKDDESIGNKISKNPSPVIETSSVKPSSSKTIRRILEIMHLREPAKHFKELRKIARRNRTESKTLQEISFSFLKRLLIGTAALIRKTTNLGGSSRKFLRRKRETTVDPPDAMESLKVCAQLRKKLPVELRLKILNTDEIEEKMIEAYAASKAEPVDIVSDYNSAKMAEREQLRQAMAAASEPKKAEMLRTYKMLRKGTPWNCLRLRGKFKQFFAMPSDALKVYEEIKRDELESVDGFLLEYSQFAAEAWQQQQREEEEDVIEEDIDEVNAADFRNNRARLPEMEYGKPKRSAEEEQFTTGSPKSEVGEVKDDPNSALSRDEYLKLSEVFKEPLRIQLQNTAAADYVPQNLLDDYYAERAKEIQLLKAELDKAGPKKAELLSVYKSIRKGSVWNFLKEGSKERQTFFKKSSSGQKEYEELKKKELDIDKYLDGSLPIEGKASEQDDKAEADGIQRASAIERDKARQEENGTESVDTASKHGDDPENVESSLKVQKDIQSKLSEWLSGRVTVTNTAEQALLESYAEETSASANLLADYNDAKAKEREVVKLEMAGGGPEEAAMLDNYKKLRKGVPWNSLRLDNATKTTTDAKIGIASCASSLRPWILKIFPLVLQLVEASKQDVPDLKEESPQPDVMMDTKFFFSVFLVLTAWFWAGGCFAVKICMDMIRNLGFYTNGLVKGSFASFVSAYVTKNPGTTVAKLHSRMQVISTRDLSNWELFTVMSIGGCLGVSIALLSGLVLFFIAFIFRNLIG